MKLKGVNLYSILLILFCLFTTYPSQAINTVEEDSGIGSVYDKAPILSDNTSLKHKVTNMLVSNENNVSYLIDKWKYDNQTFIEPNGKPILNRVVGYLELKDNGQFKLGYKIGTFFTGFKGTYKVIGNQLVMTYKSGNVVLYTFYVATKNGEEWLVLKSKMKNGTQQIDGFYRTAR